MLSLAFFAAKCSLYNKYSFYTKYSLYTKCILSISLAARCVILHSKPLPVCNIYSKPLPVRTLHQSIACPYPTSTHVMFLRVSAYSAFKIFGAAMAVIRVVSGDLKIGGKDGNYG
jgi:hypothetical protein